LPDDLLADLSLRDVKNPGACLRGGTLEQFYAESQKKDNARILNVLDIPVGYDDRNLIPYK